MSPVEKQIRKVWALKILIMDGIYRYFCGKLVRPYGAFHTTKAVLFSEPAFCGANQTTFCAQKMGAFLSSLVLFE